MSDWHLRTDTDTHTCMLCGAGWCGKAIPEERYKEVLKHFPPSAFAAPEISDDAMEERAAQVIANERFKRRYGYYPRGFPAEIILEDRDIARAALRAAFDKGGE